MLDHLKETDWGTPARESAESVTLEIDGQQVTVPEGTSIMRAAMELGTKIPKLCATDMVDAFGSCRLCLVEIEGRNVPCVRESENVAWFEFAALCDGPRGKDDRDLGGEVAQDRRRVRMHVTGAHPLDHHACKAHGRQASEYSTIVAHGHLDQSHGCGRAGRGG